ncbi:MAG TPA: rhodanese-like domain-containing protein [Thermoanaerobaculia bacterium]|nr:rhodanese-like domain-containing protein [Thermoanaerobaculia bacterium]
MRRTLAAAAAILGVLALFAGKAPAMQSVAPVELAEWIRDRKPNLRVIDTRSEAEFDEYHLPRAERFTSTTTFAPDDTVVLVAGGSVHAKNVYILRGGIQAWIDEVMNPTITADASPSAHIAFQRASVVSRYFGGVPRVVDKLPAVRANASSVRRRGC